jgi:EAL domain-containing protein (putative c-di-GMP-specific phosphodiesterase class I)
LLIEMAHGLNLTVIAEGVEEPAQLAGLADSNCEDAQGYLFSPALPASEAPAWAHERIESEQRAGSR